MRQMKSGFIEAGSVLSILGNDMSKARERYRELIRHSMQVQYKNIVEFPSYIDYLRDKIKSFLYAMGWMKDAVEDEIDRVRNKNRLNESRDILARKYLIEQLAARGYRIGDIAVKLNLSRKTIYNTLNYTK